MCCKSREMRENGWDDREGHHEGVTLRVVGEKWYLVTDWYSVDIVHCPWCGIQLEVPQEQEREMVAELDADLRAALDELMETYMAEEE